MTPAPRPANETQRLHTLRQYGVLDTLPEQALDDLTAMAAAICGTPTALISLVDEKRQWFKSRVNLDLTETPREQSFCAHAVVKRELFIVPDATKDERFFDNPLVTGGPQICFYAGAPLMTPEEDPIGALCVVDRVPRELTKQQSEALTVLARQVMTHLELHRQVVALRLSEERFASAFEHAPIGMALVSLQGRWLKVNQALCDVLGYSHSELAQLSAQEVTHAADVEANRVNVERLLAGTIASYRSERRYLHKSGRVVYANLHTSLARNREAQPLYFIKQIQDVTETREALARQQELTLQAQAADRAKSEFLATMSHEIRTPLNGVIGMANILADTKLDDMQRDCVKTINVSGESLLAVINDILDYSKIEAGAMEIESRAFDLRQCVEDVFDLFSAQIRRKRLEVTYRIAPEVPAQMRGDALRLRQVLVNLLGNAIKFTPAGEILIEVELKRRDATEIELVFSVRDSGIGIPPEKIDRLFRPFQQVDTSTSRRYGGTGLGLAICKRLAEYMGGRIWAESDEGHGSVFSFSAVLAAMTDAAVPATPDVPLLGRTVLLVSDAVRHRQALQAQLAAWGLEVTSAATMEEAVAQTRRRTFDIGIVNLQVEALERDAWAERLQAGAPFPLVLLTFGLEAEKAVGPFRLQLPKPVKHSTLQRALLRLTGTALPRALACPSENGETKLGERHPLRILLAEDNTINQKVGLLTLARLGYTADLAENGRQVLAALKKTAYDVILMDIQMPEMNGIEAADRVREIYGAHRPVIVALTAEALEGDEARFLDLGFDFYLSKPLQRDALIETLESVGPLVSRAAA